MNEKFISLHGLSIRVRNTSKIMFDCQGQMSRTLTLEEFISVFKDTMLVIAQSASTKENVEIRASVRKHKYLYCKELDIRTEEGWKTISRFSNVNSRHKPYDLKEFTNWATDELETLSANGVQYEDCRIVNRLRPRVEVER